MATPAQMPAGRHRVNIGGSLLRALKARKGVPAANTKHGEREFYSIRCAWPRPLPRAH